MIKDGRTSLASLAIQTVGIVGGRFRLLKMTSIPWASAHFTGHRHRLILTGDQPLGRHEDQALAQTIADHEFALSGATVADAHLSRISPDGLTITITLLTVDE